MAVLLVNIMVNGERFGIPHRQISAKPLCIMKLLLSVHLTWY